MASEPAEIDFLALTAQIVSAHVSHNSTPAAELPPLIQFVHAALATVGVAPAEIVHSEPAVPIKKSVFPDYIVCLEDGKKLKLLKRHLRSTYGMTPDQYRAKWGLPASYPMVPTNYTERRSAMAKSIGLGRSPGSRTAKPGVGAVEPPANGKTVKKTRRPRKAT